MSIQKPVGYAIKKDSPCSFVIQHCNVFQIKQRISIIPLSQKVCWRETVFPSPVRLASYFLSTLESAPCSETIFSEGKCGYVLEPNNVYFHYIMAR